MDLLEQAEPGVRAHVLDNARRLEAEGAEVEEVRLPAGLPLILAVHQVIMAAEASAAHAGLLLAHPDSYGPRLRSVVEVDGWRLARTKGSHRQFRHPTKPGTVTVSGTMELGCATGDIKQYPQASRSQIARRQSNAVRCNHRERPKQHGAYVPDLPGCVAVAETKDEDLELIQEAIELHIEALHIDGLPVPQPSSSSEYIDVAAA